MPKPKVLLATSLGPGKDYCTAFMFDVIRSMDGLTDVLLILDGVSRPQGIPENWHVIERELWQALDGHPASFIMQQITLVREAARQFFVDGDWTHLYWHDCDMIPSPTVIPALIARNLPIVTGLYGVRDMTEPLAPVLMDATDPGCHLLTELDLFSTMADLVKVVGYGMGCMLIERDVAELTSFRTPDSLAQHPIGEDYGWCIDAEEGTGAECWVDTTQRVWHVGASGRGSRPVVGELRAETVWTGYPAYIVNSIGGEWVRGVPRTDIPPEKVPDLPHEFISRIGREIVIERKPYEEILARLPE